MAKLSLLGHSVALCEYKRGTLALHHPPERGAPIANRRRRHEDQLQQPRAQRRRRREEHELLIAAARAASDPLGTTGSLNRGQVPKKHFITL